MWFFACLKPLCARPFPPRSLPASPVIWAVGLPVWHLLVLLASSLDFAYCFPIRPYRTSTVPSKHFTLSTSPGSQTPGEPNRSHQLRPVWCCLLRTETHRPLQPHNYFVAQSLRFRSGSVAPCPTLKPNVTASAPRTRYGRLVRPYSTGLRACYTLTAYKGEKRLRCSPVEIC